jgi:hypothetical protein
MRKFFLISAMVLASATAQAGQSRNLSPVAANDEQPVVTTTTAQPPRAAEADTSRIPAEPVATAPAPPAPPLATSPSYEERPSAVAPTTTTAPPLANPPTTTTTTVTPPAKADAPRRTAKAGRRGRGGGYWTEARIIGELHRYGIYW